eukprot:scaffold21701_cov93-Cylindrotheca_fusiformis.AAC.1
MSLAALFHSSSSIHGIAKELESTSFAPKHTGGNLTAGIVREGVRYWVRMESDERRENSSNGMTYL